MISPVFFLTLVVSFSLFFSFCSLFTSLLVLFTSFARDFASLIFLKNQIFFLLFFSFQ